MSAQRRRWRRGSRQARGELEVRTRSCREEVANQTLVRVDARAELAYVDVLVRCVGDVDGAGAEQQRRTPVDEQRDIACVRDRGDVEPRNDVKMLGGNVGPVRDLGSTGCPLLDQRLYRSHIAN